MNIYEKYVLPRVVHFTCGLKPNMRQRGKVVPRAQGLVLEIGIGSGLNLPYYDAERVSKVVGVEPSAEMVHLAADAVSRAPFEVEFVGLPGEEIPLASNSVDTIVMTYTLCSIADTRAALRQMRRVLKPEGRLLFCEHGLAPDAGVRRWQNRLNPVWSRLGGGCQLNRDIPELLREGGFELRDLEARYIPGWKPASFNYWGSAAASRPVT